MQRKTIDIKFGDIKIGTRERKEFGDLADLAASIEEHGLLQPIGVTPDHELVFGERRLRACRDVLGWPNIPARVVEVKSVLLGQIAENQIRKDYTLSERVAIVESLRSFGHGGNRRSEQLLNREDETLRIDEAAKLAGLGGKDGYYRAKEVVDGGVPELVEAMDRGDLTVSAAAEVAKAERGEQRSIMSAKRDWTAKEVGTHLKRVRHRGRQEELRKEQAGRVEGRRWVITDDPSVVHCDLLIADPPFGITDEPWEPEDIGAFTKDWCGRWSSCGADFVAIFWCQSRLWEGRAWFDEGLAGYDFQQMLVWHAPNNLAPKSRKTFKQTYEPIFLYRRVGSERLIHGEVTVWTGELHDLDCHVAPVPQATYGGHNHKQHPCQKPVSVMRWLINALSEPGERVASVFCGVSPCGVASVQLNRQYHGVEADEEYRKIAEARLLAYGQLDPVAHPAPASIRLNEIEQGDCKTLIPLLPKGSVNLVLTSPPYGEQRNGLYPGVPENLYPEFTVRWMSALWDKLADEGSVLIVLDPHVEKGVLSDYVLRTQLALREAGWKQHQTQIWHKPDGYPFGHKGWPRHCYEQVLWFSRGSKPLCDPLACGRPSARLGVNGYEQDGVTARSTDVIGVPVGANEKGVIHPARFPAALAEALIQTFCPAGGVVLDPFCGSGTTPIAAKRLGRDYYGFDLIPDYCAHARRRLTEEQMKAAG